MTDQPTPESDMEVESTAATNSGPALGQPDPPVRLRLWPAIVVVAAQWAAYLEAELREPGSTRHLMAMALAPFVAAVAMFAWWMFASRVPWRDRLIGTGILALTMLATPLLVHPSLAGGILFYILPTINTVIVLGLLAFTPFEWRQRCRLVTCCVLLTVFVWALLRSDGMDGSMNTDFAWRWATTAEEAFLASPEAIQGAMDNQRATAVPVPETAQSGDWPEFRGLQRDGVVRGITFAHDWKAAPPRELWRRAVGPGWSSFAVIEPFLFTQEQRGEQEVVVCYKTDTGEQCWVNNVDCRYVDKTASSGAGPRATPTFSHGQLFTMGATGTVQCVNASTGETIWSRDAVADTAAKGQLWGCSSSPLVVDDVVVVFAGGKNGKSVIGYDRQDGAELWTAGRGTLSYSSPHLASAGEDNVVLMLSEFGLEVIEPRTGQLVWEYPWPIEGMRIIQPTVVDHDHLIIAEDYSGARMLRMLRDSTGWTSEELWSSRDLKPHFNDFVYHEGYCYGFDGKIFTCVDAANGKRRWKGGRYGFGQLLLVVDMNALLVLSETGELVLLEATPDRHKELARFQALEGKTWNHPVIAHGKLFVRNDKQAACFELREWK